MKDDLKFMRRALALARRGKRGAPPNPLVGCVLVKNGKVVGEGWHAKFGSAHAEPQALKKAGAKARGATAYVTLEPCCAHPGKKTPPCAPALIAAGVSRVVAAVRDPNPGVSGGGLKLLRGAGVECEVGLLEGEAERLNEGFFARMRRGRPWVILKAALSLDGKAHCEGGASRWITGPSARKLVHGMRASCDAVLVGIGTALADDPALTAHGSGRNPLRVLLDTQLRLPPKAKLLDGSAPTLIFTASPRELRGAECVRLRHSHGRLPLKLVLAELARRGVGRLLVEGGPTVHAAFLRDGLVDEARVFIAPKLLGGTRDPNAGPAIEKARLRRVGGDLLVSGRLRCSPA